jgi:Secretion system C-terminal sorting domain
LYQVFGGFYNYNGDEIYRKKIDITQNDVSSGIQNHSILETHNRYYILTDEQKYDSLNPIEYFSLKVTNKYFDTIFCKKYNFNYYSHPRSIQECHDNLILCGINYVNGESRYRGLVLNIDYEGNEKWHKILTSSGTKGAWVNNAIPAPNGGFYVCAMMGLNYGTIFDTLNDGYVTIYYLDSLGNTIWKKPIWRNIVTEICNAIHPANDGGFYLVGNSDQLLPYQKYILGNAKVAKFDSLGNMLWEKIVNPKPDHLAMPWNFKVLPNGSLLLYGNTIKGYYNEKYGYVTLLDANGNTIWENYFMGGTYPFNYLVDGIQLPNGNIVLTGATIDSATNTQAVWLLGLDACGGTVINCVPLGNNEIAPLLKTCSVYPNPSNGIFNIEFAGASDAKRSYVVYDAMGKVVKTDALLLNKNSIVINPKGLFLVKVFEGDSVSNFKVIVE